MSSFTFRNNMAEFIEAKNAAVERALEAVGIQASSHAVQNIKASGRVDTGLLKNSITHAISSEKPSKEQYSADKGGGTGRYDSSAPDDPENMKAVYIGTNVEYAPYVEMGTDRMTAAHFIKNAVTDHQDEYRAIMERYVKIED